MSLVRKTMTLAVLVAMTQVGGVAYAQADRIPATRAVQVAVAPATTKTIQTKAPDDWIIYDDNTYAPVVDAVTQHLNAARKAFDAKDNKKAAMEMRAVADELKRQAAAADKENQILIKEDKAVLAEDMNFSQDTSKRMRSSVMKVSSGAEAIEKGKIKSKADLDKVINKAARADIDRRWQIVDVTSWYPITEEPQRHFTDAVMAYAKKDYKATATDIRKASSYLRLEAGRASGDARQLLDSSVAHLDALATAVEGGAQNDEQSMSKAFEEANHALALERRAKAAQSWVHQQYDKAGYELMAAAHGLESAAGWAGSEAKASVDATVADTRALGKKLVSGGNWTREEVAKGFESLGNDINALGQKIGVTQRAAPSKAGSS